MAELPHQNPSTEKSPVPALWELSILKVICGVMYVYGLVQIIYTFTGAYGHVHVAYSAVNAFIIILSFVALSSVWSLEKWGALGFLGVLLLSYLSDFFFGNFRWWTLAGLVLAFLFFLLLKRIRR